MSDSVYQAFFTAVFIVVFIVATTITVTLFNATVDYSEKAFEYGKLTATDSVVETTGDIENYNVVSGTELLTYYYNYYDNDKYGNIKPNDQYIFKDIANIDIRKNYILEYVGYNDGDNKATIKVSEINLEVVKPGEGYVEEVIKGPSTPKLYSSYSLENADGSVRKVPQNAQIDFYAFSEPEKSTINNSIKEYIWTIKYDENDGRDIYTVTLPADKDNYGYFDSSISGVDASQFIFKTGKNKISVQAVDKLGYKSKVISKIIEVGFNNPSVKIASYDVLNNGTINTNDSSEVSIDLKAYANSKNQKGYITKYEWYINNKETPINSAVSSSFKSTFAKGTHKIYVKVTDNYNTQSWASFSFVVN